MTINVYLYIYLNGYRTLHFICEGQNELSMKIFYFARIHDALKMVDFCNRENLVNYFPIVKLSVVKAIEIYMMYSIISILTSFAFDNYVFYPNSINDMKWK